ncbi:MAG: leucine-rich repeat domain-containing protein [Oscillospiraceae bacterium]|nr:leucine-rich repeat domain-containing protein [Oscillospiraceae bacterium]
MTDITIPENVNSVGSSAFYNCDALKNVVVNTAGSIGSSVFENCDALEVAIVNSNSTGQRAFYDCDTLTTVILGDGVTSIGSNMCYSCDSLTDITFGIGLNTISDSAFRQCSSLQEVILPRYCTKIATSAFAENINLTTVTVLPSMTAIENNSFSYPAKMIMRGVSGSYAQEYANSRNMTFEAINIPATTLEFYKNEIEFSGTNKTVVLPLSIAPLDSTDTITYTSADENIATVVNGVVTSKGYGTTSCSAI